MKNSKAKFSLIAAALIAAGTVAGCGTQSTGTAAGQAGSGAAETAGTASSAESVSENAAAAEDSGASDESAIGAGPEYKQSENADGVIYFEGGSYKVTGEDGLYRNIECTYSSYGFKCTVPRDLGTSSVGIPSKSQLSLGDRKEGSYKSLTFAGKTIAAGSADVIASADASLINSTFGVTAVGTPESKKTADGAETECGYTSADGTNALKGICRIIYNNTTGKTYFFMYEERAGMFSSERAKKVIDSISVSDPAENGSAAAGGSSDSAAVSASLAAEYGLPELSYTETNVTVSELSDSMLMATALECDPAEAANLYKETFGGSELYTSASCSEKVKEENFGDGKDHTVDAYMKNADGHVFKAYITYAAGSKMFTVSVSKNG